jgi:ABC-type antimicrobial peptide transport system permease subunit
MPISWTLFAIAATASLAIAALTVAYQAVKAAAGNPVDVLKYE